MFQSTFNKDTDSHIRKFGSFALKTLIHIRESQVRLGQVRTFQSTFNKDTDSQVWGLCIENTDPH